ncbi:hypothetical protein EU245_14820 [Lentibacillus lipolyticus]|nr:hypothetical protein EU245_14820 [Lentibacillus lipolyticus]
MKLSDVETNFDANYNIQKITLTNNDSSGSTVKFDQLVDIDFGKFHTDANITIETDEKGTITLDGSGDNDHITGSADLTVNAENATVNNNLNVGGDVEIVNVAKGTWNENADGNKLVVKDDDAVVNIKGAATSVKIDSSAGVNNTINVSGKVSAFTANAPAKVTGAKNVEDVVINDENVVFDAQYTGINTGSVEPQVGETAGKTIVANADQLDKALANSSVTTIELADDIELTKQLTVSTEGLTVVGNDDYTITNSSGENAFRIEAKDVTFQDVVVELEGNAVAFYLHSNTDGFKLESSKVTGDDSSTQRGVLASVDFGNDDEFTVLNTTFEDVRTGISVNKGKLIAEENHIENNVAGIAIDGTVAPELSGNTFDSNDEDINALDTDVQNSIEEQLAGNDTVVIGFQVTNVGTAKDALTDLNINSTNDATHASPIIDAEAAHDNGATYSFAVGNFSANNNGGTAVVNNDGDIEITRDGTDKFTFDVTVTIEDGNASDTKVFTVTVPTSNGAVTVE